MSRVLVIDNYDSFTWNLVHLIGPLVGSVDVVRNDEVTAEPPSPRGGRAWCSRPAPARRRRPGSASTS
jgi:anthranilate synthase component 2